MVVCGALSTLEWIAGMSPGLSDSEIPSGACFLKYFCASSVARKNKCVECFGWCTQCSVPPCSIVKNQEEKWDRARPYAPTNRPRTRWCVVCLDARPEYLSCKGVV